MLVMVGCAALGQYIFILGLQHKSYKLLIVSRVVFGVSDMTTIV